jgi:DNA polymerase
MAEPLPGVAAGPSAEERREKLVEVYRDTSVCVKCPLSVTRNMVVFGAGNSNADLMLVGEAPGAEEDRQGLPFVGRAGKFLGELLQGIGLSREEVFIGNVLKCRPPGNRDPQPEEIDSCRPWLEEQVSLIEPRVIGTLGNFATKLLTGSPTGITKVRGTAQHHVLGGRPVLLLPLFHPAAGLRTPRVAEQLREDFSLIPGLLAEALPDPAPLPPLDESAPDDDELRPVEVGPDQMDLFA